MGYMGASLSEAVNLIASADPEVMSAVWTSLYTSFAATALAAVVGIPAGLAVASYRFPGRGATITILNTLMAMPTVVIGLLGYAMLTRNGPLGVYELLYTPAAMIIGQFVLVLPLTVTLSMSAARSMGRRAAETALTLGATRARAAATVVLEGRFAFMTAVAAAFGRAVGEVGVAMMLGGNIRGATRTMTTAIALETSKGEFAVALALGVVLMTVALAVNIAIRALQARAGEAAR
ncbi:MAG TPA: ABC transporter permease [bacterium]|nr:ABC transporter permease [bacterium]